MKATRIIYLLAFAVSASAYCGEDAAARLARTRELVARHAASSVTVLVRFNALEYEDSEGFRIPYLCPNCNNIHHHSVSEYVKEDRPLDMPGYVVAPNRVMVQDMSIRSNVVASVEVVFAGRRYRAEPVRRYPAQGALELETDSPIEGARAVAFTGKAPVPMAEAQFFFHVKEKGQMVSGLTQGAALKFRRYSDIGRDVADMPANTIVLDAKGDAAALSFRSPVALDDVGFAAPATWKGEAPYALDARLEALQRKVSASLVPVYVHREEEKRSRNGGFYFSGGDDERKVDIDVVGFALAGGEVLLPLGLDASKTAEIDKIEAVMPDGSRQPLEWVGAFDKYALAVVRFRDGRFPKGVEPLPVFKGEVAGLFLNTVYTFAMRSMDGKLSVEMLPERVAEFSYARGGATYPDVHLGHSSSRQTFAVTERGEFVVGGFRRRSGEHWSSEEKIPAASFAALLEKRQFNPEYVLRSGKDRIRVAWIGVETQPLTEDIAREKKATGYLGRFHTRGALVSRVHPGTPADKAGMRVGDILLYVRRSGESDRNDLVSEDGFGMNFDLDELLERLEGERLGMLDADRSAPWPDVEGGVNAVFTRYGIGVEVDVGYVTDGVKKESRLVLAQAPVHFRNAKRFKSKALGAAFADLTYEVRGYFKLADDAPGVVVSKVQPGNPAAVAGLKPFEIVTQVDGKPVSDVKALHKAVKGRHEFNLSVRRLATTRIVRVKLQASANADTEGGSVAR